MSRTVLTEIVLPSPPADVWAVLIDFPAYPEWNPFVRSIKGKAELNADVCIKLAPKLSWTVGFCAKVSAFQENKAFAWAGGPACLLRGRHFFELQAEDEGRSTRLKQGEIFTGVFTGLLFAMLGRNPARGYEAMNEALKRRLEAPKS